MHCVQAGAQVQAVGHQRRWCRFHRGRSHHFSGAFIDASQMETAQKLIQLTKLVSPSRHFQSFVHRYLGIGCYHRQRTLLGKRIDHLRRSQVTALNISTQRVIGLPDSPCPVTIPCTGVADSPLYPVAPDSTCTGVAGFATCTGVAEFATCTGVADSPPAMVLLSLIIGIEPSGYRWSLCRYRDQKCRRIRRTKVFRTVLKHL